VSGLFKLTIGTAGIDLPTALAAIERRVAQPDQRVGKDVVETRRIELLDIRSRQALRIKPLATSTAV